MGLFSRLFGRKQAGLAPDRLVPYVVPESYGQLMRDKGADTAGLFRRLGHGCEVMLSLMGEETVSSVHATDLAAAGMTWPEGHRRALENLRGLLADETIPVSVLPDDDGLGILLASGHPLTAGCLLLPDLYIYARNTFRTRILASIPNRSTLLLFPEGDRSWRERMRSSIRRREADDPYPLTWELFTVTGDEVLPYRDVEDESSA